MPASLLIGLSLLACILVLLARRRDRRMEDEDTLDLHPGELDDIAILRAAEESFGIAIPDAAAAALYNVGDLADLIAELAPDTDAATAMVGLRRIISDVTEHDGPVTRETTFFAVDMRG